MKKMEKHFDKICGRAIGRYVLIVPVSSKIRKSDEEVKRYKLAIWVKKSRTTRRGLHIY